MDELVYLEKEEAVCSSLDVSGCFGKRHDNVLRAIGGLLENEETQKMFKKSYYVDGQNKQQYPMYLMNRDGFSLLVMGFTGKKALDWKLKYINAFNQMEKIIRERQSQSWIESRSVGKLSRKAETDVLKQLVEYAKRQGSEHADMLYMTYSKLANKAVGVTDRETATTQQLMNLSFVENIILNMVQDGIQQELPYKEIYRNVKDRLAVVGRLAYLTA
uniref:Regulatory protein n=1 Tax=virus sp. ctQmo6 TaxID=2827990 RepID=A0A8S5RGE6_9VIRU|nr:MAG TPA: regulatory protein [virus sp. ctQmo6]